MARSRWKVIFFSKFIWRKIYAIKKGQSSKIYKKIKNTGLNIMSRSSYIPNCFKGLSVSIHKGKFYRDLNVEKFHVGYKFGEYAYTRKLYYYPLKKKKRRLNRR